MSSPESLSFNMGLPILPTHNDPQTNGELTSLYFAVQTLARELEAAKKRLTALEAYNTAHP